MVSAHVLRMFGADLASLDLTGLAARGRGVVSRAREHARRVGVRLVGERSVERERMIRRATEAAQIFVVAAAGVISSILLYLMTDGLFGNQLLALAVCVLTLVIYFSRGIAALAVLGWRRAFAWWEGRQGF